MVAKGVRNTVGDAGGHLSTYDLRRMLLNDPRDVNVTNRGSRRCEPAIRPDVTDLGTDRASTGRIAHRHYCFSSIGLLIRPPATAKPLKYSNYYLLSGKNA